jgi:hypothetical protein
MSELKHIIEILERMEKKQNEFFSELRAMSKSQGSDTDQWVDSLEVQRMLCFSSSTLYRLRKNGDLLTKRLGGRYFYYAPDIFRLKDQYLK